jgi:CheY-like chemotaxis protein
MVAGSLDVDRTLADELAEATILIVDDDEDNLFLLSRMLRQYNRT